MADPIPVHPDDLTAITQRMLEVTDATGGATPGAVLSVLPQEFQDVWREWAQWACDGRTPNECGVTQEGWDAARALALELAAARA